MQPSRIRFLCAVAFVAAATASSYAQPITITAPAKNATIATSAIHVSGTVVSKTRQIGVVVNGFRAELDVDHAGTAKDPFRWFATVHAGGGRVKLKARLLKPGDAPGDNDDANGAASTIHVEHVPGPPVALLPSNSGGVVPLRVVFAVRHDLPSVTRFEADLDGNGSYEHVAAAVPESLEHTYTTPGLVIPAVRLTAADGSVLIARAGITPQSFVTMNRLLKDLWSGFTGALSRGDVAAGLQYFADGAPREKYAPVLELIRPSVKEFAGRIQEVAPLSIGGDVAYYLLIRREDGVANGHYVYFSRDRNGLWKIVQM